jgi:hypothetical protein
MTNTNARPNIELFEQNDQIKLAQCRPMKPSDNIIYSSGFEMMPQIKMRLRQDIGSCLSGATTSND